MSRLKLNANSISLAGEFAVLSQLVLRGYDANMTLGHTKGVDILVSNPKTKRMYQLEVKAGIKNIHQKPRTSKLFGKFVAGWIMRSKHERIQTPTLFYCFVSIHKKTNAFRFFIVPSRLVARYVKTQHRRWLNASPKHHNSDMRQFRIGLPGGKYPIPTPTTKYEDNWNFMR
ncbi:MAG: hypothetical protein HYS41_02195 [Candidatus Omnitrophica bacterium]|nr:hypothetical protein [Candidatus Omnitrophota bacterium]